MFDDERDLIMNRLSFDDAWRHENAPWSVTLLFIISGSCPNWPVRVVDNLPGQPHKVNSTKNRLWIGSLKPIFIQ